MVRLLLVLTGLACAVACGPRPGQAGDTCGRTDDCAEPLRCVAFRCVTEMTPEPAGPPAAASRGTPSAPAEVPAGPGGVLAPRPGDSAADLPAADIHPRTD